MMTRRKWEGEDGLSKKIRQKVKKIEMKKRKRKVRRVGLIGNTSRGDEENG